VLTLPETMQHTTGRPEWQWLNMKVSRAHFRTISGTSNG
jgi:hypothetical protein